MNTGALMGKMQVHQAVTRLPDDSYFLHKYSQDSNIIEYTDESHITTLQKSMFEVSMFF